MTLDQAIEKLHELKAEAGRGDVEMLCLTDVDGRFVLEWDRHFDLIEIGCEKCQDICEHMKLVCAYLHEPDPDQVEYPPLRLV